MNSSATNITSIFKQTFEGLMPLVVRSPGRVNIIGEHTDYNEYKENIRVKISDIKPVDKLEYLFTWGNRSTYCQTCLQTCP